MKKYIIILTLALLVLATFFIRSHSFKFKRPFSLTYDGVVYTYLGVQMGYDPSTYNTVAFYEKAKEEGEKLSLYFKKPLFKHPPLFPFLISISCKIFGRTYYSAFLVSVFFGILLIPLTYLLGYTLFDERIGMYSALLMAIEPISWISSEKIWMETTIVFFGVLSLYSFAKAIKRYKPYLMVLSGVSAGLSSLTKYPGVLFLAIIFVYAICNERWLFKKKSFVAGLFIPFIMFLPWFYWNYRIYGIKLIPEMYIIHEISRYLNWATKKYLFIGGFLSLITALFLSFSKNRNTRLYFISVLIFVLCFVLRKNIINAFCYNYIPSFGIMAGMFSNEPWHFYFGRLLELSPFYIFSFLGLFLLVFDKNYFKKYLFLYLWVFFIFAFYISWGNYQSRYILSLVAPLVIMSAKTQVYIFEKIKALSKRDSLRTLEEYAYVLVIFFILLKTIYVNIILALPNQLCYF